MLKTYNKMQQNFLIYLIIYLFILNNKMMLISIDITTISKLITKFLILFCVNTSLIKKQIKT